MYRISLLLVTLATALALAPAAAAGTSGPAVPLTSVDPAHRPWPVACGFPCTPSPPAFALGALPSQLTALGDRLFMIAFDGAHGFEPWVSDGTASGTVRLADLCPGECSSNPLVLGVVGRRAIFFAATPEHGFEPWASDGTAAGTRRLADFCPGPCAAASTPALPPLAELPGRFDGFAGAVAGGELYFGLWDGESAALVASDGERLRRVATTPWIPRWVTAAGRRVAFEVPPLVEPVSRLWWSDGTAAGTAPAAPFCGQDERAALAPPPRALGDGVVVVVTCTSGGAGLSSRTSVLAAHPDGSFATLPVESEPPLVTAVAGGRWYGAGPKPAASGFSELWASDATAAGTAGPRPLPVAGVTELVPFSGRLLAVAGSSHLDPDGARLFELDGLEESGPVRVRALASPPLGPLDRETVETAGSQLFWWRVEGTDLDGPETLEWSLYSYDGEEDPRLRQRFSTPDSLAGIDADERFVPFPELAGAAGALLLSADGGDGQQLWRLDDEPAGADPCLDPAVHCLRDGRFAVRVRFTNQHAGGAAGVAMPDSASRDVGGDTGYFWFFRPGNLELAVKVLDGRAVNGHWWVFAGGTTDLGYGVEVTDRLSGETRTFTHPPGDLCTPVDTLAFAALPTEPRRLEPPALPAGVPRCEGGAGPRACLGEGGRFEVGVEFTNQHAGGAEGTGVATAYTADTAAVRFFPRGGTELMVKVLDGRPVNGHFWVLWGGLTDLGYTLTVEDREGGGSREYVNAPGSLCGGADTTAF
ncbi:MAG TPA: hypothetical protein VKU40_14035 [Thermoanaerobaculia bacterium]|nr:hypothetical protein [Thermoanaerobaculia bacterium]